MTIRITRPEIEVLINQLLQTGSFRDEQDVIFQALKESKHIGKEDSPERAAAIESLKTFGKRHGLSLGGMTIKELRDEARP